MKSIKLGFATLVLVLSGAAGAANYIQLSGTNIDFFYDAELYGVGGVTVSGNRLDIHLSASLPQGEQSLMSGSFDGNHIVAVAHNGYLLSTIPVFEQTGTYLVGGRMDPASWVGAQSGVVVRSGTFSGTAFQFDDNVDAVSLQSAAFGLEEGVTTGSYSISAGAEMAFGNGGKEYVWPQYGYTTLAYDPFYQLYRGAEAAGTGITFSSGSLAFDVQPVPEPATYAMLLAGLGLVVWLRR